jgi:hypothetical protein
MTEVEYAAEVVGDLVFQNVEGGEVHIAGARFDQERRVVVFTIAGSAIPAPKKVRPMVRLEDGKFFTRFQPA